MWITIYCDASFRYGEAAGGYWIRSNDSRIVDSVHLTASDNNVAEIEIAYHAIKRAIDTHSFIEGILVKSDSMTAINCMKYGSKDSSNKAIRHWQVEIRELLQRNSIKIRVLHVKGHSKKNNMSSWLNNQVDSLAKKKNSDRKKNQQ